VGTSPRFNIVDALHMGHVGAKADVLEGSALSEGFGLEVRAEVVERVAARMVIVLVLRPKPPNVNTVSVPIRRVQVGANLREWASKGRKHFLARNWIVVRSSAVN
jgi:hypothetical protein